MRVKTKDIIWLAGLLEGEGWFLLERKVYPVLGVAMTDEDIVVKVSAIWKGSKVYHYKNFWRTQITGFYAIQWMMTLYTLLGKRRREKVSKVIKVWKKNNYRAPYGTRNKATCHPDRLVRGFDMCQACYDKWRRQKKLLKKVG